MHRRGLLAEHGLSLWIEVEDYRVLFDTGASMVFRTNAEALGVAVEEADAIVISHGHYDHLGGLEFFPEGGKAPPIHLDERALWTKEVRRGSDDSRQPSGVLWDMNRTPHVRDALAPGQGLRELAPSVYLSGDIPRVYSWEDPPAEFFVETPEGWERDYITDEQMLIVRQDDRLSVFSGCSHRGIVGSLEHVLHCFPGCRLHAVVAGMHLLHGPDERIEATVARLRDWRIDYVVPLHCTGLAAMCALKRGLRSRCVIMSVGDSLEL